MLLISIKQKKYDNKLLRSLSQSTVRRILSDMMQSLQHKLNTFSAAPKHVQTARPYEHFVFMFLYRPTGTYFELCLFDPSEKCC